MPLPKDQRGIAVVMRRAPADPLPAGTFRTESAHELESGAHEAPPGSSCCERDGGSPSPSAGGPRLREPPCRRRLRRARARGRRMQPRPDGRIAQTQKARSPNDPGCITMMLSPIFGASWLEAGLDGGPRLVV